MDIQLFNGRYLSADGSTDIKYIRWLGSEKPKAVVQLVHGMSEYIERYDEFARFLTENGYTVYGNNHIGHGSTAAVPEDRGHIPGRNGFLNMVTDVHNLSVIAREECGDIPFILFGHSMGSLLARLYAELYGNEITALILCGTSGKNPLSSLGLSLTGLISLFKGGRYRSKLVFNMAFGSYCKRCSEKRTIYDWLSVNQDNVDEYMANEHCGEMLTAEGFANLIRLIIVTTSKEWYKNVPKQLPVLLISGSEDPVGGYGKGVIETDRNLKKYGVKDVTHILYSNLRHEILREKEKGRVFADILSFIENHT